MELKRLMMTDIVPYENNPRYNDDAVEAVAESIRQCGYVQPIIVDEENVILCGHTRYRALNMLGENEVLVNVVRGLTEDQKKAYRLYDNKTAELASWDYDKLVQELESLDLGDFSYFERELEKMGDKLLKEDKKPKEEKTVICPRCGKMVKGPAMEMESYFEDEEDEYEEEEN